MTEDQYGAGGAVGGTGQTRTRLPDSPSDPYGTPRRPTRSSRGLVTVVGVVVLLIAAIAFANQSDESPADRGTDTPAASSPTAPSGVAPVDAKNGTIPSGFAQTEQGAQSAAANYAVALGSDGMFNTARRHAIIDAIADTGTRDRLRAAFDADYSAGLLSQIGLTKDGLAPAGTTFVSRTLPSGTKVRNFSGGAAVVDVWCVGLFGLTGEKSTNPVTSNWFTTSVTLKWSGSDWKVVETAQQEGPTPVTGDDPVSPSDQINGAVEQFGGFTYAR
ncbi:hypothetical protein [Streptomyces sp. NPDC051211]|uniref:hypothetical protein n=1 Tax=Streptomyces sp. NPDC051211 TaxID=3154643 RepID=UPI0034504B55